MPLPWNRAASAAIAALAYLCPATANAQTYEKGNWRIAGYRVGLDGSYYTLSPEPQACGGGSNYGEHIWISTDLPNRQEVVATLLAAYHSGRRVTGIWFSNAGPCNERTAINVYMVRIGQ